jgi:hypothetical protein
MEAFGLPYKLAQTFLEKQATIADLPAGNSLHCCTLNQSFRTKCVFQLQSSVSSWPNTSDVSTNQNKDLCDSYLVFHCQSYHSRKFGECDPFPLSLLSPAVIEPETCTAITPRALFFCPRDIVQNCRKEFDR